MQQGRAAPVRMLALPRWRINHLNQQEYIKLWSRHGDAIQPLAIKKNRSSMLAVVSQEEIHGWGRGLALIDFHEDGADCAGGAGIWCTEGREVVGGLLSCFAGHPMPTVAPCTAAQWS